MSRGHDDEKMARRFGGVIGAVARLRRRSEAKAVWSNRLWSGISTMSVRFGECSSRPDRIHWRALAPQASSVLASPGTVRNWA